MNMNIWQACFADRCDDTAAGSLVGAVQMVSLEVESSSWL